MTPPPSPSLARAAAIVAAHGGRDAPVLALLDALRTAFGRIPPEVLTMVAATLDVTADEFRGLAGLAENLRADDEPRRVVRVCRAESCRRRGGWALGDQIAERLGAGWYGATADGRVRLEPVYCLGLCESGPSAMVDDRAFGRLDRVGAEALVEALTGETTAENADDGDGPRRR